MRRRLVEEVSLNLAYRWYVGYELDEEVPNHSVFSKARKRFGKELFVSIFDQILKECAGAGLIRGEGDVFVDSTLIKANASTASIVEVELDPEIYWRSLGEDEKPVSNQGKETSPGQPGLVGRRFLRQDR